MTHRRRREGLARERWQIVLAEWPTDEQVALLDELAWKAASSGWSSYEEALDVALYKILSGRQAADHLEASMDVVAALLRQDGVAAGEIRRMIHKLAEEPRSQ